MFYYGACYYPEHWTAAQVEKDIALMQKARFNVVRMGEFAWTKFEPEQGRYRFEWLDSAIKALHEAGISTVLCTPTCIPPQWVYAKHADVLQEKADGTVQHPGSRCHCCKNAPAYQMLSEGIVREMAKHYAKMEGVIGWQVDNEFGCHGTTRCFCDHCKKAFREWVRERYGSTDAVNEAWGTSFWGFDFHQWYEIPLPRTMPAGPNPGHWLDFLRFSSDSQVGFQKIQYDLLKDLCPGHFVTHNCMGCFPDIDYYRLSDYMDFPVWDNYPNQAGDPLYESYAHEITRSFKGHYWVMEERSGTTGDASAGLMGEQPEPGEIRRWAWQSSANGADGIVYFRWRACLTGAEQYWHGILDHDSKPRRRYREVRQTGKEFARLAAALEGTQVVPKVALIRSFDTLWSLERQPGAVGFSYDRHCFEMYRAVKRQGLSCDMVSMDARLDGYVTVLAPSLSLVDETVAASLAAFVRQGGTLVLTPQSGARTMSNAMWDLPRPGLLAEMVGATVEEVRPYHQGQTNEISFARGSLIAQVCAVGTWVELLECDTAEALAEYRDEAFKGKAAITRNEFGEGVVYYLGVYLSGHILESFLRDALPRPFVEGISEGLEITERTGENGRLVFVVNNTAERKSVTLPGEFEELLTGETVGPNLKVSGNGVLVLRT